jgi:hypothetical protein
MCRTGTELALYSRSEQQGVELNTFKTPTTTGLMVLGGKSRLEMFEMRSRQQV